ncbi:hypothetical protein ACWCPM_05600 [Streptomyces sp. NPDC002309]
MATKAFSLNTDPHVAQLGALGELHFVPEVMGDAFLDGYADVLEAQRALGDGTDLKDVNPEVLRGVYASMKSFLATIMTPESAARFLRFEVIKGGKTVANFRSREEAEAHAASLTGTARVEDKSMRLPDRVLVELPEWTQELYGGGNRPTGSSSGSSRASRRASQRGKVSSPSKASTSTAGRSAR